GGAAGGLGGALAALGGRLVPGFELVADELDLYDHMAAADLVITGEGRLDDTSFAGKVVGGVRDIAIEMDLGVLAVVGSVAPHTDRRGLEVVSLVDVCGEGAAMTQPKQSVERAVADWLGR
ncbi:MAG TPA: glycerate kinase, partial [Ilumatobacteraceae bacterium]|nr:glycerate kinase [Ilumatobacteraceae bacterium]